MMKNQFLSDLKETPSTADFNNTTSGDPTPSEPSPTLQVMPPLILLTSAKLLKHSIQIAYFYLGLKLSSLLESPTRLMTSEEPSSFATMSIRRLMAINAWPRSTPNGFLKTSAKPGHSRCLTLIEQPATQQQKTSICHSATTISTLVRSEEH